MKYWKDLEKHGRGGDTMMKKIDDDLAHVNAVEYEMSPEYIKEHGSGTTNPVTGKKEYFDPFTAASLGLQVGSMLVGGFSAMGNKGDVAAGRQAAGDIYQEQLGMIGEQRNLSESNALLDFEVSNLQTTSAKQDTTLSYQNQMQSLAHTTGKTNLVTSGSSMLKTESVKEKFNKDMTKIFDTMQLNKESKELKFAQAGLSEREAMEAAETQLHSTQSQLDQIPNTFVEGLFG